MKLIVLLMALAVCSYASPIASSELVEKKVELPSMSAMIVTELLEVTFKMDADLAKQIGHLFRDVPLSIAKEMVAFIGKVFADVTGSHVASLSQYMEQAMHIFSQVWQHIDVKEVVDLIASEVLPANVVAMLEKLMAIWGRGAILSALAGAAVTAAVNWTVNTLVSTLGKRGLLNNIWDAVVDAVLVTAVDALIGVVSSIGKRGLLGNLWDAAVAAVIDTALTGLNNALIGVVESIGKRGLLGNIWTAVVDAVVDTALTGLNNVLIGVVESIGKREARLGPILTAGLTAAVNWGVNQLVGVIGSIGKRGAIIDSALTAVTDTLTTWFYDATNAVLSGLFVTVSGWFGKRDAKLGLIGGALVSAGISALVNLAVGAIGKRGLLGNLWDAAVTAVVDTALTGLNNVLLGVVESIGKRGLLGNLWDAAVTAVVDTALTGLNNALLGVVASIGKRGLLGNLWDAALTAVVATGVNLLIDAVSSIGKRGLLGNLWDAAVAAVVTTAVDALIGAVSSIGKRDAKLGLIGGALVSAGISALVNLAVGAIGKRGVWDTLSGWWYAGTNVLLSGIFSLVSGIGKRQRPSF